MTAQRRALTAILVAGVAGLAAAPVAAGTDFRLRAAGRTYRCGDRVVEVDKGGGATFTRGDDPAVSSTTARWSTHGVTFTFPAGAAGPVTLSEFGATVSLKASGASAVCVNAR